MEILYLPLMNCQLVLIMVGFVYKQKLFLLKELQREREINSSTRGECVGIPIFDEEEGSGFRNRIQELEWGEEKGGIHGRGTWTTPREFKVEADVLRSSL